MTENNPFLHRKAMIAIGGMSGTGKTTLAEKLAEKYGFVLLDSDALRKQMHGVTPETRLPDEAYAPANTKKFINYVHQQATKHLKAGRSVIVTGTFLDHQTRSRQEELARRHGAEFIGMYLHAPVSTLYDRVARRDQGPSDATPHVVNRQSTTATRRPFRDLPWKVIRAHLPPEQVQKRAVEIIERHMTPKTFTLRKNNGANPAP